MPIFYFILFFYFFWLWWLVLNKLKPIYCKWTQNCSQTFHCPQDWGTTLGIQRQFIWFVFRSPELFGVVGSSDRWCYHIYWATLGQRLQRSRCSFYSCQIVHIFWKLGSAGYPIDLEHSDSLTAFRMDSYFLCKLSSLQEEMSCLVVSISPCKWSLQSYSPGKTQLQSAST